MVPVTMANEHERLPLPLKTTQEQEQEQQQHGVQAIQDTNLAAVVSSSSAADAATAVLFAPSVEVARLQQILEAKPKAARVMASISFQLMREIDNMETMDTISGDDDGQHKQAKAKAKQHCDYLRQEAIHWARTSIKTAPHKPFGYSAMSMASLNVSERLSSLEQTVQIQQEQKQISMLTNKEAKEKEEGGTSTEAAVSYAVGITRLLLEPREEEVRKCKESTNNNNSKSTSSSITIKRRDLSVKESNLYRRVKEATADAQTALVRDYRSYLNSSRYKETTTTTAPTMCIVPSSEQEKEKTLSKILFLVRSLYKLGMFFRKMDPQSKHRTHARSHFTSIQQIYAALAVAEEANKAKVDNNYSYRVLPLPLSHEQLRQKSLFWLATIQADSTDNSTSQEDEDQHQLQQIDIDKCPQDYIVSLYSTFASNFDNLLVHKLQYRTPTLLRELVNETVNMRPLFNNCVDLGCGTGLSGLAFRDCITNKLFGVDLSPEMIEKARERPNCYSHDGLLVSDVDTAMNRLLDKGLIQKSSLNNNDGNANVVVDLVIACDVFVYLGDLQPVFQAVHDVLSHDGGRFAFSTELLEETYNNTKNNIAKQGYRLQETARFAHKCSYLTSLAGEIGFDVEAAKTSPIRKNAGRDIMGTLMILKKKKKRSE
jgi:predicted TPR repeat methyltransferase